MHSSYSLCLVHPFQHAFSSRPNCDRLVDDVLRDFAETHAADATSFPSCVKFEIWMVLRLCRRPAGPWRTCAACSRWGRSCCYLAVAVLYHLNLRWTTACILHPCGWCAFIRSCPTAALTTMSVVRDVHQTHHLAVPVLTLAFFSLFGIGGPTVSTSASRVQGGYCFTMTLRSVALCCFFHTTAR
eukprot:SAG31_NODE_2355_length_5879_cov_6.732526_3_plen_185_part_00